MQMGGVIGGHNPIIHSQYDESCWLPQIPCNEINFREVAIIVWFASFRKPVASDEVKEILCQPYLAGGIAVNNDQLVFAK